MTFQPVHIPYEEIWALPSFNPGDMFMGLRFLDESKGEEILAGLAIDTFVAGRLANEQEQMVESALAGGTVIPAEALNATHTSYDKTGGTVLVHRAEALLVKEYIESLNLDAGKRFKTPEGGIADLYIEGQEGIEIVEAKRGADRQFVRQTLSQLLDYAPHSPKPADLLTALFPSQPASSSIELLHRYGIDCVYRTGPGVFTRLAAPDDIRFYLQQRWSAVT
ncbi:hypothetical protein [Pseudonocardia yunnanensis]|uniref:DUF91 domain-containing protein n=1 Tax=Pseudonocardia yunnanensis TaxID=58107 RepID=A0ABW4F9V0_9PSEU